MQVNGIYWQSTEKNVNDGFNSTFEIHTDNGRVCVHCQSDELMQAFLFAHVFAEWVCEKMILDHGFINEQPRP